MLITALNDRIDAQVILVQIPLAPRIGIGAAAVLLTGGIHPVIDHMLDFEEIAESDRRLMQSLKLGCGIQFL